MQGVAARSAFRRGLDHVQQLPLDISPLFFSAIRHPDRALEEGTQARDVVRSVADPMPPISESSAAVYSGG